MIHQLREAALRYGLTVAIAASLPALIYVGGGLARENPGLPFGMEKLERNAVSAENGPGAGIATPERRPPTPMPALVKGIYVTAQAASVKKRFGHLVDLVDATELNSMVIDVKDGNGELAFVPQDEDLKKFAAAKPVLGNLADFTAPLRAKDIYLIARVFVFQDPALVKRRPDIAVQRIGGGIWRDRKGVPWVDPSSLDAWKYSVAVAKEAYDGGFDEIQFDYIRFPSDGNLKTIKYAAFDPKTRKRVDVINDFFAYLDKELRQKNRIAISADLFGLVMWQHESDLGIGQRLEIGARHFDAISPMVYPSHYATGFNGYANPAAHPYEVVRDNMKKGKAVFDALLAEREWFKAEHPGVVPPKVATARPWLQDFDLGADYTPAMVRAQIKAAEEEGASGWLLWNARNVYSESALEKEK